jgi:hypothetical protein
VLITLARRLKPGPTCRLTSSRKSTPSSICTECGASGRLLGRRAGASPRHRDRLGTRDSVAAHSAPGAGSGKPVPTALRHPLFHAPRPAYPGRRSPHTRTPATATVLILGTRALWPDYTGFRRRAPRGTTPDRTSPHGYLASARRRRVNSRAERGQPGELCTAISEIVRSSRRVPVTPVLASAVRHRPGPARRSRATPTVDPRRVGPQVHDRGAGAMRRPGDRRPPASAPTCQDAP